MEYYPAPQGGNVVERAWQWLPVSPNLPRVSCFVFFGAYPQLGGPLLLSFFFLFFCKEWHSVIHFTGVLSICVYWHSFSWNSFHWCRCTYQSHILHAILTGHFTVVFKELRVSSYQPSVGRPSQCTKQWQTLNELQLHIPQTCVGHFWIAFVNLLGHLMIWWVMKWGMLAWI